ncbi:unnamed protein product [Euphydryas editha]|uniref:Uncharacterized protein n=1 Tax=Euphydryas editha TaxID=104508 RepID=A0AAU9UE14_EUPED|nr:unnamed protein product [Euphydryas editha]
MDEIIININIFILIHISLYQCVSNLHYQYPQSYTRAAYYDQYDDQEDRWSKSNIESRRQKNKYYISAELNHGSRRLKCKCKTKKRPYVKQRKNCYCDNDSDKSDEDYERYKLMDIQFPTTYYPLVPWFVDQDSGATDEENKKGTDSKENKDKDDETKTTKTIGTTETTKTTAKTETEMTIITTETTKMTNGTTTTTTAKTTTTTKPTNTTVPVIVEGEKILKDSYKKKKCFRNNCLKRKVGSRIGRYFYNDLVLRPTLDDSLL